jgi:hypothetical protein
MYIATICFGFPIKTLMTYVYAVKTGTEYKLKPEDYFDTVICGLIAAWVYVYLSFSRYPAVNPNLASTPDEIFMYTILIKNIKLTFHFDVLLAIIASTFWLRMFLMLKLTKTFGPLIRMIYAMMQDVGVFLVLWMIQLAIFTCTGMLIFGEIPQY